MPGPKPKADAVAGFYRPRDVPRHLVDSTAAAEILGLATTSGISTVVRGLPVMGRVKRPSGSKYGPLWSRADVKRLLAARKKADAEAAAAYTAPELVRVLGANSLTAALKAVRAAGVASFTARSTGKVTGTLRFPRAAVDAVAGPIRAAFAAAKAEAARDRAERRQLRVPELVRAGDGGETHTPAIMYGVLDHADAQELARRRAKHPYRPAEVA